jgi:outer membrane protein
MKKTMGRLAIIAAGMFLCGSVSMGADEIKLGFVNAQRIIEESKSGKEAYKQLKELQDTHKQSVEAKKAEIDKSEEELQRQYLTLADSAKAEKEEQLRKAKKDFQRMLEDADADIGRREKAFLEKIDKEVMVIIQAIGKEKGYTLIFGQIGSAVLYANPVIDLTDEVIKKYDAPVKQ